MPETEVSITAHFLNRSEPLEVMVRRAHDFRTAVNDLGVVSGELGKVDQLPSSSMPAEFFSRLNVSHFPNLPYRERTQRLVELGRARVVSAILEDHLGQLEDQIRKVGPIELAAAQANLAQIESIHQAGLGQGRVFIKDKELAMANEAVTSLQTIVDQYPKARAISEPTPEPQPKTYAEVEQRINMVGRKPLAPGQKRLIEAFLPPDSEQFTSREQTIESLDLLEVIRPGTSWETGGSNLLKTTIYRARRDLDGTNVTIRQAGPVGGGYHLRGRYFLEFGPMPEATSSPPLVSPPLVEEGTDGAEKKSSPGSIPIL